MIGTISIYSLVGILCLLGFFMSCLSLSGTWLVMISGVILSWFNWPEFPGIPTLIVLLSLCIITEVLEAVAGAWGVKKRGGSNAAGWAALVGGFLGMILGGFIPVPVAGNLLGMFVGSFGCAFIVEHSRMQHIEHAAHVATGAVLARVSVIFIKIGITLLMILLLGIGSFIS